MENFDVIVVIIGIVLIIAGVGLFITGKVVSQNNQIEAFGIKINFNNPSFMLVVAGIGMVLVPRLLPDPNRLPDPEQLNSLPPTSYGIPAESVTSPAIPGQFPVTEPSPSVSEPAQSQATLSPTVTSLSTQVSSLPSIAGNYELMSYTVNNIPQIVEGSMSVEPDGNNQYQWHAQYDSFDFYGNYMHFVYSGDLDFANGNWFLDVNASNDPTWFDAGSVATQLLQEGEYMGLSYVYHGNFINAVWEKTD